MGFGIAFLGYCFLLLHSAGFGAIGAPLLAYGFFLASRLHKKFLFASVSALFMLPRGIFLLLDLFLPLIGVELDLQNKYPTLNTATYLLFFLAWLSMIFFHCTAVRDIAKDNRHEKLEKMAMNRLYVSALFILVACAMVFLQPVLNDPRMNALMEILFYIILLVNLLWTHTCLVMITSEKQYEEDKEFVREENRKAEERKNKTEERKKKKR